MRGRTTGATSDHTSTIAALHRDNFEAIRAVALDATVRDPNDGRVPLIARGHPWRPFNNFELAAQVLAFGTQGPVTREVAEELATGRRGKRYTPVSDYLHDTLRPKFQVELPDDEDFSELFDRVEVLLALLATDLSSQRKREETAIYVDGPFYGRFTWRDRHRRSDAQALSMLTRQLEDQQERWPPLRAGLFGGALERARAAVEEFTTWTTEVKRRHIFM